MADLRTRYLGLELAHPLVPSASPLSRDLDMAKRLEDAGAPAIVMYSLFEEELYHEQEQMVRFLDFQELGHSEASGFLPSSHRYVSTLDGYLKQLTALKAALSIPVIASLNGISLNGWVDHGKALQEAGADALELNAYYVAANMKESASDVENRYVALLREVKRHVTIPVTMKLSSQFSSPAHFVKQLEAAGAEGAALFNRFYQPDIDLETLQIIPRLYLSSSMELLLRIHWIAVLYGRVGLSLAVTGGVHTPEDAAKALLVGADVVHLCSALLLHGPQKLPEILQGLNTWMEEKEYASVVQLKGSFSQQHISDPSAFERANYMNVLNSYTPSPGIWR